jgi:hypothetical protein
VELIIPDIGDLFTHDGQSYRVDGWLKDMAMPEAPAWDRSPHKDLISEILYEAQQKVGPNRTRVVFCVREEAQYVAASGIAGRIVRVEDVKVTGRVDWPEEMFDHLRHEAAHLIGRPVL